MSRSSLGHRHSVSRDSAAPIGPEHRAIAAHLQAHRAGQPRPELPPHRAGQPRPELPPHLAAVAADILPG